jgi:transcriptional regulator with XRE-family HTH domain
LKENKMDLEIKKSLQDIDSCVGNNLRRIRTELGISERFLAVKAGISWQQVQKYEKGENRIAASKIFLFANVLGVPIQALFDPFVPTVSNSYMNRMWQNAKIVGENNE